LERDTWRLEVVADPTSESRIEQPLSIDFDALMRLADTHAVRYVKALACNNIGGALGVGLWESVPHPARARQPRMGAPADGSRLTAPPIDSR
jgi:hypothetical protein